jgi:hypothetical protein
LDGVLPRARHSQCLFLIAGQVAWLRSYDVVGGQNVVRLRDVAMRLDFYVGYSNGTILIDTTRPYAY